MISEADDIQALAQSAELIRVTSPRLRPEQGRQPVVLCVVRNEMARLPYFLIYYRRLGAAHFLFIDNGSTDGSREFLASQPDVDLFETHEPFNARVKHGWITRLIRDYGDRWYLLADADEHAVFDGAANLPMLAGVAERLGRRRVRGALLDMYSDKPLALDHRRRDQSLLQAYPFFDPDGYMETRETRLTSRTGGPRQRALSPIAPSFKPQLTKYPLFRLAPDETIVSPHYIDPPLVGEDPCWIALLHFKFDGDAVAHISDAIARGQYWRESYEYRIYNEAMRSLPGFNFMFPGSRRYKGAADLVNLGIIEKVMIGSISPI
jgi:hypothetical protein